MDWGDIGALGGIVVATNGILIWAVKWLLARNGEMQSHELTAIRLAGDEREGKISALKQDISLIRECLPRDYVRREDWIISFSRIEQKIDAIWQYIHTRGEGG